ncbi:hypothetical protein EHO60_08800 [Leptospira fletcheri]|uniref:Uncharacterized protein n=1 Tax=Leptospira fletcheri TaxID=2484981 RepID=A0A4R9GIV0_9LEPT|nr:hypothetical protein [Leptospira fletcheri]TGK12341.1 hypothetical protein EHO60_08800 [Leptospira fletcheri]
MKSFSFLLRARYVLFLWIPFFFCVFSCRARVNFVRSAPSAEIESKKGIPDPNVWNGAFLVSASEIGSERLKKILADPNNFSRPESDSDHVQEGFSEMEKFGARVFLIIIKPKVGGREVSDLGETGIRLGECDAVDKLEYPYTYVVFPEAAFGQAERYPKTPQEAYKSLTFPRKKARHYYEEETRRILAAFPGRCFVSGENRLEVQILGSELLLFRFLFQYGGSGTR